MTALLVVGALLAVAQAVAGVVLWRRDRRRSAWVRAERMAADLRSRAVRELTDRIDALEAQALTFARHSDALHPGALAGAEGSIRGLREDVNALRADLEQHRAGSRHRRAKPTTTEGGTP